MTQSHPVMVLGDEYRALVNKAQRSQREYAQAALGASGFALQVIEFTERAREVAATLRALDPEHADAYPDPELSGPAVQEPELATGLRELADLIAKHPELAEHCVSGVQHCLNYGTPEEQVARVDELAVLLGVGAQWRGPHYGAWVPCAGGADFKVVTTHAAHLRSLPPVDACCWESKARRGPCDECSAEADAERIAAREAPVAGLDASIGATEELLAMSAGQPPRYALDVVEVGERAADALRESTARAEEPVAKACLRCGAVFGDECGDGKCVRQSGTAYCQCCVDHCHEGGDGHRCSICQPEAYGTAVAS